MEKGVNLSKGRISSQCTSLVLSYGDRESQSNLDWEGCTEIISSNPLLRAALINSVCLTFRPFNRVSVSSVKHR